MISSQRPWIIVALAVAALLSGCDSRARNKATLSLNEALSRYEGGNYSGAVRALEEAIQEDPSWGEPHYYLGMIRLMRFHAPGSAAADLQRAVQLMPDHAPSHYLLGTALLEEGDRSGARRELEAALRLTPNHSGALYRLGMVQEAQGEIMEAIDSYSRSIRAEPDFAHPYNRLGNIYALYDHAEEAIAVFREGFENAGDAVNANDLARMYLREGNREAAIEYFREALSRDPESISYNYNLGMAYFDAFRASEDTRDRRQAQEFLDRALDRCSGLDSQARCNAIRIAIADLETVSANE